MGTWNICQTIFGGREKCNWLLRFMISMSDGVWLYTDKEVDFSTKVWAHLLCDSDDYAMPDLD